MCNTAHLQNQTSLMYLLVHVLEGMYVDCQGQLEFIEQGTGGRNDIESAAEDPMAWSKPSLAVGQNYRRGGGG